MIDKVENSAILLMKEPTLITHFMRMVSQLTYTLLSKQAAWTCDHDQEAAFQEVNQTTCTCSLGP